LFCAHVGHWVQKCPAKSPEARAHGHAMRQVIAADRNGSGPAPPPPLPLGVGPPVAPVPPAAYPLAAAAPVTAAFVHAVKAKERAHPGVAGDDDEST